MGVEGASQEAAGLDPTVCVGAGLAHRAVRGAGITYVSTGDTRCSFCLKHYSSFCLASPPASGQVTPLRNLPQPLVTSFLSVLPELF